MRNELETRLVNDFPTLCRKWGCSPMESCFAFGFDVGNGWEPIIRRMCARLSALKPIPALEQVKEKWGTLRVYTSGGPRGRVPLWAWPLVPFTAAWYRWRYRAIEWRLSSWRHAVSRWRRDDPAEIIVADAERESAAVCETCGEAGIHRQHGYMRVTCAACETDMMRRRWNPTGRA